MLLRMCLRAPITLICALIMSFTINSKIASIFLVAIVFLGFVLGTIVRFGMKYFGEMFKKYDELNANIQENVSAIRVVKAFVREDYEKKKFGKAVDGLYNLSVRAEKIVSLNNPVMNLTVYGCMIAISWFAAHMIVGGTMTTGNLTSLFSYCMNILFSLMMLSMVFVMMSMSIASAKRITEVLREEADIVSPENAKTEVKDGSVDFNHAFFSYDKKLHRDKNILTDIDVHIKSGETIGIIGGTGCGKTSFVNLISRLYDVTSGSVCVGGVDVREYELEALRNQVSVVLQKNELFSGTVLENLRWGDENATEEECIRVCKMACADDFIQRMPEKYNTYIEQGGSNVSGGQKQRLCIARALLKKPKILILDDSTSAVDTATDARIRRAFREEIPNTTKFIIAQRISSIQDADRIIVLDNGYIDGVGTHEELLENNEIYRSVYEVQTQGGGDFDEPKE
jgi:ATP-binding cassette subfamily B protein